MKDMFKMGMRSLVYRRRQYVSLFLVCIFGVAVSLFSLFLINGMLGSLRLKAKIYYGGDFQLIGETPWMDQHSSFGVKDLIKDVFPEGTIITERYDYNADNSSYYFEGTGVRQRVIKGVNFDIEEPLFSTFKFTEGSAGGEIPSNGVLLSEPIANMLKVHVGDEIVFMLKNVYGYINTVPLIVHGIFLDSSLFGMYTSYVDHDYLLDAISLDSDLFNRLCITLPTTNVSSHDMKKYQTRLENLLNMFPLVFDKQQFYDNVYNVEMPCYALIPLSANLEDLQILIDAMGLISGFVIVMLIIIIVAGISSTFRVIVMKRINEIGIYKAIGMKRYKIMSMLLTETLLLLITGCISGFLLSLVLCKIASCFNLSFIPAFDIFLSNGSLSPQISVGYIFLICGVVIVTTLIAVMFSVKKSVSVTPCEALAVTE